MTKITTIRILTITSILTIAIAKVGNQNIRTGKVTKTIDSDSIKVRLLGEEKNKNTGVILVFCFAHYNFNQLY